MPENSDMYLTRREAEIILEAGMAADAERMAAHMRVHEQESAALDRALSAAVSQQSSHNIAHDKAHLAHEEKHKGEGEAVHVALNGVAREREIHASAHEREHLAHLREHGLEGLAIGKAEQANDKRFIASNAYREQLNDMITHLASRESVEALVKETDRRFEDARKDRDSRFDQLRHAIGGLERTDVKAEGKDIGRGMVVAYIVTAVTLIGGVLAIVIILSNALSP